MTIKLAITKIKILLRCPYNLIETTTITKIKVVNKLSHDAFGIDSGSDSKMVYSENSRVEPSSIHTM